MQEVIQPCSARAHHFREYPTTFFGATFFKNRQIRDLPQPMPATSVGTFFQSAVSPYVTFDFARLARAGFPDPSRARQQAVPATLIAPSLPSPSANAIPAAASAFLSAPSPSKPQADIPTHSPTACSLAPQSPSFGRQILQISTFRRFHQKPSETRSAPTHARHKRWHVFPERCVTLCHLRFCTTCAQVGAAKPNRRIPPTIVSRYNLAGPASNLPACNCSGGISKCVSVSPSPASFSS